MDAYEKILVEFSEELIIDDTAELPADIKGFYVSKDNKKIILLNRNLKTINEKVCILAEEIGHHYTSVGDITDQSKTYSRKQEFKARRWAVRKFIRIEQLIEAFNVGIRNRYELAEYLDITEEFLDIALNHFKGLYGISKEIGEYIIYFDPLMIFKKFA